MKIMKEDYMMNEYEIVFTKKLYNKIKDRVYGHVYCGLTTLQIAYSVDLQLIMCCMSFYVGIGHI